MDFFTDDLQNRLVALKTEFSKKKLQFALCGMLAGESLFALGLPDFLRDSESVLEQVQIPCVVRDVLASIQKELDAQGVMECGGALNQNLFWHRIERILKARAILDHRLAVSLDDCRLIEDAPWGTEKKRTIARKVIDKMLGGNSSDKIVRFYDEELSETVTCWTCTAVDTGEAFLVEVEPRSLDLGDRTEFFRRVYDVAHEFLYFADNLLRDGDRIQCYDSARAMTRDYLICREPSVHETVVPVGEDDVVWFKVLKKRKFPKPHCRIQCYHRSGAMSYAYLVLEKEGIGDCMKYYQKIEKKLR
jgi:hypothetical protein